MTVAELIEKLSIFPGDSDVEYIYDVLFTTDSELGPVEGPTGQGFAGPVTVYFN